MSNKTSFWSIRAEGREADIDVFGVIGDISLWEESASASDFIREVRGLGKNIRKLNINIHSEGGSVFDAFAMYQAIRAFPGEKIAKVPAMAFSAASYLMLAADTVEIGSEAVVMIHNPMAVAIGNHLDMLAAADHLKKAKDLILNVYERRTGGDREHLSELMDAETWFMGGDEAKAAGFADSVMKDPPKKRMAAISEDISRFWRNAPKNLGKPKSPTLKPEIAARLAKLREGA